MIDPMYNDTVAAGMDQWIPIRPGTDAALVEAIAYELIKNNWVDQDVRKKNIGITAGRCHHVVADYDEFALRCVAKDLIRCV